jgi:hypothetical protein
VVVQVTSTLKLSPDACANVYSQVITMFVSHE